MEWFIPLYPCFYFSRDRDRAHVHDPHRPLYDYDDDGGGGCHARSAAYSSRVYSPPRMLIRLGSVFFSVVELFTWHSQLPSTFNIFQKYCCLASQMDSLNSSKAGHCTAPLAWPPNYSRYYRTRQSYIGRLRMSAGSLAGSAGDGRRRYNYLASGFDYQNSSRYYLCYSIVVF